MKHPLLYIAILLASATNAQNLVPNPSFEEHTGCPDWYDQLDKADGWSIRLNTPDYYHTCGTNNFSVPFAGGSYQCPASGSAFCLLHGYLSFNPGSQEFVGRQLEAPLLIGQKYFVSFKINLPNGVACASNNFGVLFSNVFYGDTIIIPAPVINNFAHIYTTSIITDSIGWKTVSGSFVADSAYQYIIVGNFFNNISTDTMIFFGTGCNSLYFIDDVCVSIDSFTCIDITNQITDFDSDSTTIQAGSCINFNLSTVVDYDIYTWQFPGATPNISTDSMPSNICYDSTGSFNVILIAQASGGCADTIIKYNYITVLGAGTGIYDNNGPRKHINIYPNPTKNLVQIEVGNMEKLEIEVYNLLGELVYKTMSYSVGTNIDFTEEPPGIYVIKLKVNNQIINKRIVINP